MKLEGDVEASCETAWQKRKEMANLDGGEYEVGGVWDIMMCVASESLTGWYPKCKTKYK